MKHLPIGATTELNRALRLLRGVEVLDGDARLGRARIIGDIFARLAEHADKGELPELITYTTTAVRHISAGKFTKDGSALDVNRGPWIEVAP